MIQWSCLFVAYVFIRWTDQQEVKISPSGILRAKESVGVFVRSTYVSSFEEARIVYNGKETYARASVVLDAKMNFVIGPFTVSTTGLGGNLTHRLFQFNFTVLSQYDGATIRVVGINIDNSRIYSQFLNLTVLSSPCCNVSKTTVEQNTTEMSKLLQLNCSDIIRNRGNPPAMISWIPTPGCNGMPSGDANQFYTINSISRQCNSANVTGVADTKDASLEITTKTFRLIIRSPPGDLMCSYDGLIRPLARFSWNEPQDDGGFPVTEYNLSVNGKSIDWVQGSLLKANTSVNDGDELVITVSAINVLGLGKVCTIREIVPTRNCTMPIQGATTRTSIQVTCLTATRFVSGGYTVYYVGNGVSGSQGSNSLPITVSGLGSNITYVIIVEADNSVGIRENSSSVMMSTNPPGEPGSVTFIVKDVTTTSFTLMFDSVQDAGRDNATVAKYRVCINNQRREFVSKNENEKIEFLINNLTSNTLYNVTVTVVNNLGEEGDTGIAISVTTLKEDDGVSDGLSVGIVVSIAVACCAIAFIFIVVTICFSKSRRGASKESHSKRGTTIEMTRVTTSPIYDTKKKTTAPLYADVAPISQSTAVSQMTNNPSYQVAGVH